MFCSLWVVFIFQGFQSSRKPACWHSQITKVLRPQGHQEWCCPKALWWLWVKEHGEEASSFCLLDLVAPRRGLCSESACLSQAQQNHAGPPPCPSCILRWGNIETGYHLCLQMSKCNRTLCVSGHLLCPAALRNEEQEIFFLNKGETETWRI